MSLWFTSVAAAALIAGSPAPPAAYEPPCPSGVSGGLEAGNERESLLAGPLAVFPAGGGYADYPARYIASIRTGLRNDLRALPRRNLSRLERGSRRLLRAALRTASDHRYPGFGAAATMRPGGVVTLAVSAADREHVGLLFDRRAFRHSEHGYRVADGTTAVRLRGCTAPYTQYHGGFVVDGPRCARLEAWVDGAPEPERRVVSFGAGACPA